ncbi:MAG: hypothetical protein HFF09_02350 [Oscillospiraceae bacterium]|nr:hypothetical protein [Oscillospiraceae bacterium]
MKLLIKQRVFSWTDAYDVYDQKEEPKYFVKAEFFTIGHVIHVYDRQEREVGCIRQRIFTLLPKFELEVGGHSMGELHREFSFFSPSYTLTGNGWEISGDFFGWEYGVNDGARTVMSISKELFHWGDTYVLDIADPRDELLCLLIAIGIDAANCSHG